MKGNPYCSLFGYVKKDNSMKYHESNLTGVFFSPVFGELDPPFMILCHYRMPTIPQDRFSIWPTNWNNLRLNWDVEDSC